MIDGKFTAKERAYLSSLPAVKSVSASHIRYSDCFRVEVMCRYNAGESPSAIFREAGLDPKLIGYKRVERCIARWKQQERDERRKRKGAMNHYLQDVEDDLSIAELQGATHEGETNDLTEADVVSSLPLFLTAVPIRPSSRRASVPLLPDARHSKTIYAPEVFFLCAASLP